MATPGQPSGTYNFQMTTGMVGVEVFHRLQIWSPETIRKHWLDFKVALNLEMIRISSPGRGINLWKVLEQQVLPLVEGQAIYPLTADILAITEMWYTTVNGNGAGYNLDRIMVPITREQYAMIPNKLQPGIPTQFWFQRLAIPQVTIWQPAQQGGPTYQITYNALQRLSDAGLGSGETPDVVYRAYDMLCARMAYRMAPKLIPRSEWGAVLPILKQQAEEAWEDFAADDQEKGPMIMAPNVAGYGRMR